ncbi:DUF433 domain-containing protein [Archaeoglobus sp.]
MEEFKWVEINPEICSGKPVVKGTRIPVKIIFKDYFGVICERLDNRRY